MNIIPRFNKSLCGCTVETGSMIISWICVILISLEAIIGALYASTIYFSTEAKTKPSTELNEEDLLKIKLIIATAVAVIAFAFVINLLLLIGVYKRNHCLMTPWVIISGIGYVLLILAEGISLVYALFHPAMLLGVIFHIIFTGFGLYSYLIIYSHYRNLIEERAMNVSNFKSMNA